MWRYSDSGAPFDESILIPPLSNNKYYINLDQHLTNIDKEIEPFEKKKHQSCCLPLCCFNNHIIPKEYNIK